MRNENWTSLGSLEQLESITKKSNEHPVVLFKHSTRCSVSHFVEKDISRNWSEYQNAADFYWLDLIQFRPISNAIAERFNVRHESPQLLLMVNEKIIYHASHQQIDLDEMLESIRSQNVKID